MTYELKTLPLSAIRTDLFDQTAPWDSTLSLGVEQLRECEWSGFAVTKKYGVVLASTFPSASYPGFIHYDCVASSGTSLRSKKPFHAIGVGLALDQMLSEFDLKCSDLKWKQGALGARDRNLPK